MSDENEISLDESLLFSPSENERKHSKQQRERKMRQSLSTSSIFMTNASSPLQNLKLVPWINWEEWMFVYQCFYYDSIPSNDLLRSVPSGVDKERLCWEGVKRISAWRSRGKVPISVESTSSFVEIQLKESVRYDMNSFSVTNWKLQLYERSSLELRMLYSIALIRFVNGMVDTFQKGVYALPITLLAEKIRLPRILVDIRHEATHSHLPSLSMLREAAKLVI